MRSVVGQSSKDLFENRIYDKIVDFIKENIENDMIEDEDNVGNGDNRSCISRSAYCIFDVQLVASTELHQN